ncbi:hypothetical protein CR513_09889, partial [Mucuna pruriens]
MDAYSKYNQIRMHPQDEAKTTFIIDTETFYYKVMLFGTTYQQLMDRVFKDIMAQDMEVYVQAEKLLGFMLTERRVEANLEKCQTIINMRSSRNIIEVQQPARRITTLSRFLSQLAEIALPIFHYLKKSDKFLWTEGCEEAF